MAKTAEHGTLTAYRYGCRCEECKAAKAQYKTEYTARKKSGDFVAKQQRKPRLPLCMPIVLCMARDFGFTRNEIGKAFGCNGATITNRLNAIGYKPKEQRRKELEREAVERQERRIEREQNARLKRINKSFKAVESDLNTWRKSVESLAEESERALSELDNLNEWIVGEYSWYKRHLVEYEPQIATCKHCGDQWLFWPSHEKYGRKRPPVYCSNKCNCKHYKTGTISDRLRKRGRADEYRDCIPLDEVIERDNGICYLCGCKTSKDDSWLDAYGNHVCGDTYPTRDHVIPIAKGGTHTWDNVRLACRRCNSIKNDRLLEECAADLG